MQQNLIETVRVEVIPFLEVDEAFAASEGEGDFGYNARTETFENLYKSGVIDPAKVSRVALEHAASIASMLLTTECVITDIPEADDHSHPAPPMGGMPGMM